MVRKGDTIDDVIKYVEFRIHHLELERQKIPFVTPKNKIQQAIHTLSSKVIELERMNRVLHEDIKGHSKYEWKKWQYLEKKKIEKLKESHE